MSAPTTYRQRYVAFVTDEELTRGDVKNYLSNLNRELDFSPKVRLIFHERGRGRGLVRCEHMQLESLKEEMESSGGFTVKGVSGTIKKARQKFLRS